MRLLANFEGKTVGANALGCSRSWWCPNVQLVPPGHAHGIQDSAVGREYLNALVDCRPGALVARELGTAPARTELSQLLKAFCEGDIARRAVDHAIDCELYPVLALRVVLDKAR